MAIHRFQNALTKTRFINISQSQDYDTYPVVKINSISSQTRQLSVNSSGRVDEYEISKSLDYEIIISENNSVKGTLKPLVI